VSASDVSGASKSQMNFTDSVSCTDTSHDRHIACLSAQLSSDLLPPAADSLIYGCDSFTVAEIIQSSVISSRCESRPEDCYSGATCEASNETSSNTELSCDTVIACSDSHCML